MTDDISFTFEDSIDTLSRAALTPLDPTQQRRWIDDLGAEHIERHIPGIGRLEFFNADTGQWLTKKGEPARKPKRVYSLDPLDAEPFELDRVSSIPGCLHKPALLRWYEDGGAVGAIKAYRLGELKDVPDEEIGERVRLLELGADAQRDAAAVRGTGVHDLLECWAKGQDIDRDHLHSDARPWYDGARAAWERLDPEAVEVEQIICHPEDRYAGRPDLVARIGGVLTLVDYKTSGHGHAYKEAHLQTRLYERARRRCGFEPCERILIVAVNPNGGYSISEGLASDEDAEALLSLYRAIKRIDSELSAQRRAA